KGPAVRGPRAQADRSLYRRAMQTLLAEQENLTIRAGTVEGLAWDRGGLAGVRCADGSLVLCGAIVLTAGTFLRGMIHVGSQRTPAGRIGEPPAEGLAAELGALGLPLGRLKTGTPPRIDGRTVDWAGLDRDRGDEPPEPLSSLTGAITNRQ